jgi:hypothetical protein
VWFDELNLRPGCRWADEMASGLVESSHREKLVVFFLDNWGCRRKAGQTPGFCVNEITVAVEHKLPILTVGLSDAIPPPALAVQSDAFALDLRPLFDADLKLAELEERQGFKALQDRAKTDESVAARVPGLGNDDAKLVMSAYFAMHGKALSALLSIAAVAEGCIGQPSQAMLTQCAAEIGARVTPVSEFRWNGMSITDWTERERQQESDDEDDVVLPGKPVGATEPASLRDPVPPRRRRRRRIVIAGESWTAPLAERLRVDLEAHGHWVEVCLTSRDTIDADNSSAQVAIKWAARGGRKPTPRPQTSDPHQKEPTTGRMIILLTEGAVERPRQDSAHDRALCKDQIMYANYAWLRIVPLLVRPCEVPLEICSLQYVYFAGALIGDQSHASVRDSDYRKSFNELDEGLRHGFDLGGLASHRTRTIQQALPTILPMSELVRLSERFVGRQWMRQEIFDWLQLPDAPSVLIYEGLSGTGKTAFAFSLSHNERSVVGMHFASVKDQNSRELKRVVLNLAAQMTRFKGAEERLLGSTDSPARYRLPGTDTSMEFSNAIALGSTEFVFKSIVTEKLAPLASASFAVGADSAVDNGASHSATSAASSTVSVAPGFVPGIARSHSETEAAARSSFRPMLIIDGLELIGEKGESVSRFLEDAAQALREHAPDVRLLVFSQPGHFKAFSRGSPRRDVGPAAVCLPGGLRLGYGTKNVWVCPFLSHPEDEVRNEELREVHRQRCEEAQGDLKLFIREQLLSAVAGEVNTVLSPAPKVPPDRRLSDELLESRIEAIAAHASGNFLYATTVLDMVSRGYLDVLSSDFDASLPVGMDKVYEEMWSLREKMLGQKELELIDVVLALLEPLPVRDVVLRGILSTSRRSEINSVIENVAPLFSPAGSDGELRPFHPGLISWLKSQSSVDIPSGHLAIAKWAYYVILTGLAEADKSALRDNPLREAKLDAVLRQPGGQYALRYLEEHLKLASSSLPSFSREALEIHSRMREDEDLMFMIHVTKLRDDGFSSFFHGSISSRGAWKDNQVSQLLDPHQNGGELGTFLVRLGSTGEPVVTYVDERDHRRVIVKYIVYELPDGSVSTRSAADLERLGDEKDRHVFADMEALIALLQARGTLRAPVPVAEDDATRK